jgi:hypothetical protein
MHSLKFAFRFAHSTLLSSLSRSLDGRSLRDEHEYNPATLRETMKRNESREGSARGRARLSSSRRNSLCSFHSTLLRLSRNAPNPGSLNSPIVTLLHSTQTLANSGKQDGTSR